MFASPQSLARAGAPLPVQASAFEAELSSAVELVRRGRFDAWIEGTAHAVERSYLRLPEAAGSETWLICWPAGSSAPLHDHGHASGSARVLRGTLRETRIEPGTVQPLERVWTPGRSVELPTGTCHAVHNHGPETAYSIHVYAPRLERMTFYARVASGALEPLRRELASEW